MDRRRCCRQTRGPRPRGPPQRDRGPGSPRTRGCRRPHTRCCRSPRHGRTPAEVFCRCPEDRVDKWTRRRLSMSTGANLLPGPTGVNGGQGLRAACVLLPGSCPCRPAASPPAAGHTHSGGPRPRCRTPARRSCHTLRDVPHTRTEDRLRSRLDTHGTWGHICKHTHLHLGDSGHTPTTTPDYHHLS